MGLAMTQDAVRALRLQCTHGQCQVLHYAREPLPSGALVNGQIEDIDAVGAAIARATTGTCCKNAAVALTAPVAGVWQVTLPAGLAEYEMEALAELEALERLPSSSGAVWVDFAVLGTLPGVPEQLDVLLAAAQGEPARRYGAALKRGGVVARVMDVDTLARERAAAWLMEHPPDEWVPGPGVSPQLLADDTRELPLVCGLALREMPR